MFRKRTKESVRYIDHATSYEHCEDCTHFEVPRACEEVEGDINPPGWCELWRAKMPSTSQAQHGFAGMSSTPEGRAKLRAHGKTPMPQDTAKEFLHADKGRDISKLKKRASKE